jgi:hypothetical protein
MSGIADILNGCKGFKIFPCAPREKLPATADGWKAASDDPVQIAEWRRLNPNFNWAIACGPSGLFVVDVDPEGLDWWHKLLERDAPIREAVASAYQVRTPRGGLHIYFKGQGPSTASRIAAGIDTRGGIECDGKIISGGYVLLPGSRTSAGAYTEIGGSINPLPEFMRALVPERKKADTLGLAKNPDQDQPRNVAWVIDLLKGYVQSGRVSIEGKGGDNTAFQVAASVMDKGISPGLCFDLLREHWNPHCSPPWEDWELETKVRNASVHGEDTSTGAKGFQSNVDAFAAFAGQEHSIETADKPTRRRLMVMGIDTYAKTAPMPEWLVPGIIPARGIGMIYGASGSYKSFISLDLASCIAHGHAGQWGATTVAQDVIYFAGEGPDATAKMRRAAWLEWQGVEGQDQLTIINQVPFYHDKELWDDFKIQMAELNKRPKLIVIDTLARLLTGMDENSAKDATMVTTFMEDMARFYECFVLSVHHTGKDESKGARGSSAFYANMDMALHAKKHSSGTATEIKVKKQKDADVRDDSLYLKVKEVSKSIVLERVDSLPETSKPNGKSRYTWAGIEEVTQLLSGLGGKASMSIVVAEIAGTHGLEKDVVRKQLNNNSELSWLRAGANDWAIPQREYDL